MTINPVTIAALRAAIERRDAAALLGFYHPDAVLRIIDQDHPPSRPAELVGRDAIGRHLADACGRDMTHRVADGVAEGDRIAFRQDCAYPTGARVACQIMLQLDDGRIARQDMLVVWDE